MKIYLDNGSEEFRKIVKIECEYSASIIEDVDVVIDALKAYGYDEDSIKTAFTEKCVEWGLIKIYNVDNLKGDGDND